MSIVGALSLIAHMEIINCCQEWTVDPKDRIALNASELPHDMRGMKQIHDCHDLIVYQKLLTRTYLKKHEPERDG